MASLAVTGMTCFYRIIAEEGFHAADFNLFRNAYSFLISLIWLQIDGNKPWTNFPSHKRYTLVSRTILGQVTFLLVNIASPMAPISLIMVCWTTSPFWTSIVARFMLSESIVPLEIVSMIICFSAVVLIALQRKDSDTEKLEEDGEARNQMLGLTLALIGGFLMAF